MIGRHLDANLAAVANDVRDGRFDDVVGGHHSSPAIRSAARHARAIIGPLGLPEIMVGNMDKSTTRRFSAPRTRKCESSGAAKSDPIRHVPQAGYPACPCRAKAAR